MIFAYMFVGFSMIVKHRQITFHKNKISKNKWLTFGYSGNKFNQHREGHIVYISWVLYCPVTFLEKYLQKTNIKISKVGKPLIGRTLKTDEGHKFFSTMR